MQKERLHHQVVDLEGAREEQKSCVEKVRCVVYL
jgi:hypothetical protein